MVLPSCGVLEHLGHTLQLEECQPINIAAAWSRGPQKVYVSLCSDNAMAAREMKLKYIIL